MNTAAQIQTLARASGLLFAMLLPVALADADETVIELQAETTARGDYVRLGDVARVQGENSSHIARLFLGPAPEGTDAITFSREEIRHCLSEAGCAKVVLRGAEQVKIIRAPAASPAADGDGGSRDLPALAPAAAPAAAPPAKIGESEETLVTAAIARLLSRQFRRDDLEGEAHLLSLERTLPPETAALEAREVVSGRLPGRAEVRLLAVDKMNRPLGFVVAKVDAWASAPALLLARALKKGEAVAAADLVVAHARLQPGAVYLPAKPELVIGCQAARPLRSETPLAEGDLEMPWAVRKNEIVAVDTMAGGFRIRSVAKALANGRVGAAIAVENPETRKIYLARVSEVGKVEVVQDEEK